MGSEMCIRDRCMNMRGAKAAGSTTQTSALRGIMKTDARTRAEALALLTK